MSDPHAAFLPARPAPIADGVDDSHGPALRIDTSAARIARSPCCGCARRSRAARRASCWCSRSTIPWPSRASADALPALPVQLLGSQRDGACRIYTLLRR